MTIWMQTATGRAVDLMAPTPEMIDLEVDVAEALAREPRFGGHVRSGAYSVAQHCVLGTDCILTETGSLELARAFLLHDAHEAYAKDLPTPLARALHARTEIALPTVLMAGERVNEGAGAHASEMALLDLKNDLDRAIHTAAGASWPLAPEIAAKVKAWDIAMLQAERAHLLSRPPRPWAREVEEMAPARLRGKIVIWPWPKAADAWRARLHQLFPHLTPAR